MDKIKIFNLVIGGFCLGVALCVGLDGHLGLMALDIVFGVMNLAFGVA